MLRIIGRSIGRCITAGETDCRTTAHAAQALAAAIAITAAFAWGRAYATTLYATGFETPPFVINQPVAGQDGWTSRLGSSAGTISTLFPSSSQQSLELRADQLPVFGFGFNLETVRRFVDFNATASRARAVYMAVDARLNGPVLKDDLVEAILSAPDPNFMDYGQMQISADGHLYVYGSQFQDVFVGSVSLDAYHRLAMIIDFEARATTFALDGIDLATFAFDPSLQTGIVHAASLSAAAPTDPLLADPSLYTIYFDNYEVRAIPEPASFAVLLAAAAGCVAARSRPWRRR